MDPDVEVFVMEVGDEIATKGSKTPFLDFQKTYEMFDPKLTVTTIENKFETDIDYFFSTAEPTTGIDAVDEELMEAWEDAGENFDVYVNEYTEADIRNSYAYLDGRVSVSAEAQFDINLNYDFDAFEEKFRVRQWNWYDLLDRNVISREEALKGKYER